MFQDLLLALRAMAEPTRLRLLALLARSELTVTEITQVVGQSQPRVSRHLKLLCDAGLLERVPEGAWAFFRLADGPGGALARELTQRIPAGDPVLAGDLQQLEIVRKARAEVAAAYFRANAAEWARIRALYIPEAEVEHAVRELLSGTRIDSLIDLGTGTGRILEIMSPQIGRGVGVDLSHDMLAVARAQIARAGLSNCSVRLGDVTRLTFPDSSFDAAVLHQVLHFLENPSAAIAEAARVLKPGGRLLVIDFAPHGLEFLRDEHAHRRLGFAESEVKQWADQARLTLTQARVLPPRAGEEKLTVCIWLLQRPAAHVGDRRAA
jgi:ArsR family transcriptional regulator